MIDFYFLNVDYSRMTIVDQFISMVWTERYDDVGEFELIYSEEHYPDNIVKLGRALGNSKSNVIMLVEQIHRTFSEGETAQVKIKGRSLQSLLMRRSIFVGLANPNLKLVGTTGQILKAATEKCFVTGKTYFPSDAIDGFSVIDDTLSVQRKVAELKPGELLERIKPLMPMKGIGFEVFPKTSTPGYICRFYHGAYRPHILSSDFDSFKGEETLSQNVDFKNIAYVWSGDQTKFVTATYGTSVYLEGISRRIITIEASDIRAEDYTSGDDFREALYLRGYTELYHLQPKNVFSAEIADNVLSYIDDYNLGDILKYRGRDGEILEVRVTENIWTVDVDGFKSYPTVTTRDAET